MSESDQVRAVRDYYLDDRANGDEPSIYHIWERGAGRGNVTTPATNSPSYRDWMTAQLRRLLAGYPEPALLSLGCGNAMIESAIVADGVRVLGVDAMQPAVELARARGVDATCADVLDWTPPAGPWTVVYADGSLGHLYDPDAGLRPVLDRFRSWMSTGSVLVLSNDPPWTEGSEVEQHPDLRYYFLGRDYLHRQVEAAGFADVTSTVFTFEKPESGPRDRIVVTGRA